jgi:hypothetical protein
VAESMSGGGPSTGSESSRWERGGVERPVGVNVGNSLADVETILVG